MVTFEAILCLLLLGVFLAGVARRLQTPYPVLLAGLGAALAFVPHLPDLTLDPELALALFVAPVLLDAAFDASPRDLRDNWRPVAGLTLAAVVLTTVGVALVVHLMVPGMPWAAAVALGAIVAPPDASAATAVLRQLRPPHRVMVVLEAESLFNDASALLIYRAAVGAVGLGAGPVAQGALWLVGSTLASAVVGVMLARLVMRLLRPIQDVATFVLAGFIATFLVWIGAEKLHLSGIITMVCYAITIARTSPTTTPARLRIPTYAVWEVVVFALNILVFILVGLQLRPLLDRLRGTEGSFYLVVGAVVCLTAIAVRFAWVMSYNTVVRWKNARFGVHLPRPMAKPTIQGGLIISWCGMRGIVTLAAALALPDGSDGRPPFPYRDLLLFCAFCVVLGTLVIQGLTLRPLMLALGLRDDGSVDREVRTARIAAAEAALNVLGQQPPSEAVSVMRREYESRVQQVNGVDGESSGPDHIDSELANLHRRTIAAERQVLASLRDRGEIGDDAFHRVEEELDWAEVHATL